MSVILINRAKTMMTNKLSRAPITAMLLLMTLSKCEFSVWSSFFDEDVVKLFQTSLGNDAFSISATNWLCRLSQSVDC